MQGSGFGVQGAGCVSVCRVEGVGSRCWREQDDNVRRKSASRPRGLALPDSGLLWEKAFFFDFLVMNFTKQIRE